MAKTGKIYEEIEPKNSFFNAIRFCNLNSAVSSVVFSLSDNSIAFLIMPNQPEKKAELNSKINTKEKR